MSKLVFLIADGMGDLPLEALGGRTPMEAAATPVMDAMAREGMVGLCRTVPEGMAPGSDVANMALLGFDPAAYHTGRGPIEAAAMGLSLGADDVVFRLNTVTVSELSDTGLMRDYSAGHIATEVSTKLVEAIGRECCPSDYVVHPGVQYRHLLVAKGAAGRAEARVAVRPPHDITDQGIAPDLAELRRAPDLWHFVQCAGKVLAGAENASKANAVWPWGQGRALALPDFAGTFGLRGAVVSAVDLVKGLGRAAGMAVLDVPGATGLLDTNYEGKVAAALDFLKIGDFVFVHVEAPDECGHAGDAASKTEAVARFDARIVAPMREALGNDVAFLIACDHPTPIVIRTHSADPVPFLFFKQGVTPSGAAAFSEREAAATGLAVAPGHTLLPTAVGWANGKQ
ncbi:phosphonopyruvate decarboxylase-related protein [Solidesulfovibrio fructosivorans JJ]]|uniref:Phosphonopyruvate decarboxylase-related protein n=1 Tax=Solidesulfovibrio fructosivorans JJ] TaxID=596151 RepID=E1JUZ5_SOLFR|nr:cofactor-independent phosphoglycerate mutase [Solidesulfovibrio fructosivorans]EFL51909.1 phosphonopyruvate decarboxylase-related protein [Solidesulfovibrio fructosivorans JJ]]